MALDIPALARAAVAQAYGLTATAWISASVKMNPTSGYTPSADTSAVTWGRQVTTDVLKYGETNVDEDPGLQRAQGATQRRREAKILVMRASLEPDFPGLNTRVVIAGVTWKVHLISTPPGNAIHIFTVRT